MAYDLIKISGLPLVTPDSGQDIVVGVGDYAKRINYGDVKNDMVGTSPTYTTDTEPYLMRRTAHVGVVGKCALNRLIGGSLGWNQLYPTHTSCVVTGDTTHVSATVSNGMVAITGTPTSQTTVVVRPICTVPANHVCLIMCYGYTNFAWGRTGFGYVTTDHFMNKHTADFEGTARIRLDANTAYNITNVRFGTYDLTAMFGSTIADYVYSLETSSSGSGIAWLRQYIDIDSYHAYDAGSIQSVQATAHVTTGFNQWNEVVELGGINSSTGADGAGNVLRTKNYIPLLPNTQYYIKVPSKHSARNVKTRFYDANKAFIGTTQASGTSVSKNAIFTPPANARFVRFQFDDNYGLTYTNDICINISKTTGTPKNGDYVPYDGHTYSLGSDTLRGVPQLASGKLAFDGDEKYPDGTIKRKYGSRAYQSGDTSDGATMITDGTTTVYKLTTPTTESSTSYQKVQTIDADGTESFTTSSPVPVGHETQTPDNVLAALNWLGE